MTGPKVVGTIPTDAAQPVLEASPKSKISDKPTRTLPTERVGFQKQLELLRGYVAISSQGKRIVTNTEVSELVKIHPNTAILAQPFFLDVGFLKKEEGGYSVSSEVSSYVKAIGWNAETAPHKLGPLLRKTWFGKALMPRLAMNTVSEREATELLAGISGAGPKYESQLKTILAYLVASGLMRREGDAFRQGLVAQEDAPMASETAAVETEVEDEPRRVAPSRESARGASSLSTAFSQAPDGVLRFNVEVNVDLKDFATWQPDRIAAFWSGIAQVLAAKAAVEQEAKR